MSFHIRRSQPPTAPAKRARYTLTESVDGAPFVPCGIGGNETKAVEAETLAAWLAARAYFWREQGYTRLFTETVNQVVALKPNGRDGVIVRLVETAERE